MAVDFNFDTATPADVVDAYHVFFPGESAADLVVSLASFNQVSVTAGGKTLILPLTNFTNSATFGGGGILSLRISGAGPGVQDGTAGNDYLVGDLVSIDYPNTISGGAGDDVIQGGGGSDLLTGGAGNDIFRFSQGDSGLFSPSGHNRSGGYDIVTDFDPAHDHLQVFGLPAGSSSNFKIAATPTSSSDISAIEQQANNEFAADHALRYVAVGWGAATALYYSDDDGGEAHGLILLDQRNVGGLTAGIVLAGPPSVPVINQIVRGADLPGLQEALVGGAGDDLIVEVNDSVLATGGPGSDTFKLSYPRGTLNIFDYQPGQDHLDFGLGAATAGNFARIGTAADFKSAGLVAQTAFSNNHDLTYVVVDVASGQIAPHSAAVFANGPAGFNSESGILLRYAFSQEITQFDILGSGTAPPSPPKGLTLSGGPGPDSLEGGAGDDTINGGNGVNVLHGNDGNDSITGGADFDDINGNKGNDTVHGGGGDDWVSGGQNDDMLYGDDGHDLVYGNLGNDSVYGGAGDDWIRGGQGNDIVDGGAGNDLIWGDRGDDTLTGGAGADVFHTFVGAGVDRVTDFNGAEGDRIVIDDHGASFTVTASGNDTVITLTGGLNGGDTMILQGVSLASFHNEWISVAG